MQITPVILCGGSGTRLWPLSRESCPKQFVDLGNGRTLFKDTLARIKDLPDITSPIAVCNEAHQFFVNDELKELGIKGKLVLEPAPRNTAPAIALAAYILSKNPDKLMLVLPADHYLADKTAFADAIISAAPLAEEGKIVTFGVKPDYPAKGYGYIRAGIPIKNAFEIAEFVEKPEFTRAKKMFESGDYYWNSGIFLMSPEAYLKELEEYSPKIAKSCFAAIKDPVFEDNYIKPGEAEFFKCPEDSIDYAIMEKTRNAVVMPLNTRWSDLGSWEAFFREAKKDKDNNAIQGTVITDDVHDCYLHSSGRLLTAVGISNLMVVETSDAVVVAERKEGQKIKELVNNLKKDGNRLYKQHPLEYKPWGSEETLAQNRLFRVRLLTIKPGAILPLHLHRYRTEHWAIVSGEVHITIENDCRVYTNNENAYAPAGIKHRLANMSDKAVEVLETQTGNLLEEDLVILEISDNPGF